MTLAARKLDFAYDLTPVLRGVSFAALDGGALTAVIGPNAAGKSTLFRCIAGLVATPGGMLFLDGEDVTTLPRRDRARRICYLPQSYSSNAALTVFEVVLLARMHLGRWRVTDRDAEAVAALLARVGVESLAETYVGELSGGQQQLVSICQALAREPEVFLLDEPTSALDLRHQLEVLELVRSVTRERGCVTLVALHDLNLAARFADRLLLMADGACISEGAPDEVLRRADIAHTYGVQVELLATRAGGLAVSASLHA